MKKGAILMLMALSLLLGSVGRAAAGFGSYDAHSSMSVTYDSNAAASNGVFDFGYTNWYGFGSGSGNGIYNWNWSWNTFPGTPAANSNSAASGNATSTPNTSSSTATSFAESGSYLTVYNSNDFDVFLPITTTHSVYAYAYSNAEPSGFSQAYSQTYVYLYNGNGVFQTEFWYANAISTGTFGDAGPFDASGTVSYFVDLTPGYNYLTAETYAYGFTNVTAVPEPASMTLLGLGAVSLAGYGWRRRNQAVTA